MCPGPGSTPFAASQALGSGRPPRGPGSYRPTALPAVLGAVLRAPGSLLLLLLLEPPDPRPPPHGPRGSARRPHTASRQLQPRALPGCSSRTPRVRACASPGPAGPFRKQARAPRPVLQENDEQEEPGTALSGRVALESRPRDACWPRAWVSARAQAAMRTARGHACAPRRRGGRSGPAVGGALACGRGGRQTRLPPSPRRAPWTGETGGVSVSTASWPPGRRGSRPRVLTAGPDLR